MSKKKKKNENKPKEPVDKKDPFSCTDKCLYKRWYGFKWGEVAKRDPNYIKSLIIYGKYVPKVIWDYFVGQINYSGSEKDKERREAAENCYIQKRYATIDEVFK